MDMKEQLDKMFDELDAKNQAKREEAERRTSALSARRNAWLDFVSTTLEPALTDFVRALREKGVEVEATIDNVSTAPGGSVSMLVASQDRSARWQPSSLTITCMDTIKFTGVVWGREGKSPISMVPVKGSPEDATREMVERYLLAFAEKVVKAAG